MRRLSPMLVMCLLLASPLSHAGQAAEYLPRSLPHFGYLEQALVQYRALAADPSLTDLPALPARRLGPGDRYSGAPALRRLLRAVGDLPAEPVVPAPEPEPRLDAFTSAWAQWPPAVLQYPNRTSIRVPLLPPSPAPPMPSAPPDPEILDADLVAAIERFQQRHGLEVDGVLGAGTWRALTTPLARRVGQIELTLQRWRQLPPSPWPRAIYVNVPQFRLYAVDARDARPVKLQMDVIVGRTIASMNTPTFSADMTHLIFRPYWDVPRSIATAELLPAERRRPGYLAGNNLEVVDGAGRVVPISDSSLAAVSAGTMRLRQRPGEDNSLGRVKFVLPNSHAVYLHDTPHRELFARRQRAFSHGCVRVSDPTSLAQFVLQDLPEWSRERIGQALLGSPNLRVDLPEPMRVYIVYGTALAREDGTVSFHDDIYGLDARERAGGPVMR